MRNSSGLKRATMAVAFTAVAAVCCGAESGDGVVPVNVASGRRGYTDDERSAFATASRIRKTGEGTLVSSGIGSFGGEIEVAEGTLEVADGTGLGTSAGGTRISAGATLKFASPGAQAIWMAYQNEPIVLEGPSAGESILVTGESVFLENLTLEGDATIRSDATLYLGTASGRTIDMGGKTLTLVGPSGGNVDLYLGFANVANPGNLSVRDFRQFELSAALTGGGDHVLSLAGRTSLFLRGLDNGSNWTIRMDGSGGVYAAGALNVWEGPVELGASPRTISVMDNGDLQFKGAISGTANMTFSGPADAASPRLILSAANSFTGTLTLNVGSVCLETPQAVPSRTAATPQFASGATGDSLVFTPKSETNPNGWTAAEFWSYADTFRAFGRARPYFKIAVPPGEVCRWQHDFKGEDYSLQSVGTTGGELQLVGTWSDSPRFRIRSVGPVVLAAADGETAQNALGVSYVDAGTLALRDLGFVDLGADLYLAGAADSPARLVLSGKTVAGVRRQGNATPQVDVANGASARGVLEVASEAALTNKVNVGMVAGSCGLVRVGGFVRSTSRTGNVGSFGGAGHGVVEVSSGSLVLEGLTQIGALATGYGELRQTGGLVSVEAERLAVGLAGVGVLYQTGGQFQSKAALPVCGGGTGEAAEGGEGVFTLAGAAQAKVADAVALAGRGNGVATLNLNGNAVLEAPWIRRAGSVEGSAAYVNFDGGTIRTTGTQIHVLGQDSTSTSPDRATVFAGGVVLDVGEGQEIWLSTPLRKPEGRGLVGPIAVPGAPRGGYLAPPRVVVTGDGTGATAVADFDFETGAVTGVTVTSPGWNYTKATVSLVGGGVDEVVSWDVTPVADEGTGGLTKRGEGLLRLAAASTYSGPTVIEGGLVRLGCDDAIPAGSEVVLRNGATFDCNGKAVRMSRLTYGVGGGTLQGRDEKVVVEDESISLVISVDEVLAGRRLEWKGDLDYAHMKLTVVGDLSRLTADADRSFRILFVSGGGGAGTPTLVSSALPDGWAFRVGKRGIAFRRIRGALLIVR